MRPFEAYASRTSGVLAGIVFVIVAGCGTDDGIGKRYPVSGRVTYKGEPIAQGTITFDPPTGEGRAASGTIQDGSYTLSTLGERDGALPGEYRVSIVAKNADFSKVLANAKGGAGRQDDVFKANQAAKDLVPPKYQSPEQSGLKATVEAKSNTFDFKLE